MNIHTKKQGATVPVISPDILEARRSRETLERELIFGYVASYAFYKSMRDVVCPWDPRLSRHRQDFSVGRYNTLYRAIDTFYRRFDNKQVGAGLFMPPLLLNAMLIDWGNKNLILLTTAQELVAEVNEEIPYTQTLTLDSLTALSHSAAFRDWLEFRVMEQTAGMIQSQRGLGILTMGSMENMFAEAKRAASLAGADKSTVARSIGEFQIPNENDGCLIGPNRFLSREAIATLVGPSGIGKSTLAMQMAIGFSLGQETFGLKPSMSLKILIIQGENDDGDIAEMRDGVIAGLGLSEDDKALVSENVTCLRCNSAVGREFIHGPVRRNLQQFGPDLLIIDPALCYIGGDSREQKVVGEFLRTFLLPELQKFRAGCLLLHHTNKPPAQNPRNGTINEDAYAEGGSSEFRNVARAVISLKPIGDGSVYELRVPKRGNRLGWKDDCGQYADRRYIRHSTDRKRLFWEPASENEVCNARTAAANDRIEEVAESVLTCISRAGEIDQAELFVEAKKLYIGEKLCRAAIAHLLDGSQIQCREIPRKGARPGKRYSVPIESSVPIKKA